MTERPVALSPDDFPWVPLEVEGEAAVRTVVGTDQSRTLGAGLARFRDCEFEWRLGYDEALYVLEGGVEVQHSAGTVRATAGDILFVPRGSEVIYRFAGPCTVFFATYPVDWGSRSGA